MNRRSIQYSLFLQQGVCLKIISGLFITVILAFAIRMLEWPAWQNPEYRLGNEMLLATHDAYHWVAGAVGYGRAIDHPMAQLLRLISSLTGAAPAVVAFWFPAIMASLVSGIVYLWVLMLANAETGIAAGLIASISPGFLGRTLLGFYDTDLVTLFFPLLISLAPAIWAQKYVFSEYDGLKSLLLNFSRPFRNNFFWARRKTQPSGEEPARTGNTARISCSPCEPGWIIILAISGLIAFWTQQWHSLFPYILRYNVFLLGILAILTVDSSQRKSQLICVLCYCFPALCGIWGCIYPCMLLFLFFAHGSKYIYNKYIIILLWLICIIFFVHGEIFTTFLNQINAYIKQAGDSHTSGGTSLVFPSVAQSIIEVQDLSFTALFPYFHPWLEASLIGITGFILVLIYRPCALFLLPLAILAFLSSRLGGRMVMFGAPIIAIGLSVPCYWLFKKILGHFGKIRFSGLVTVCFLLLILVAPFLDMIPAMSQGPIINRRHAAALSQAGVITPADAKLWLWWDWGYAAQYFARRATIADGAEHGGPSLYLPAAVFATDNPRFGRQIIQYTAQKGNEPGNFFKGLDAQEAEKLLDSLRSPDTPLVGSTGKQYIIVSFEMLKLGFWISNFGNWNFITASGEGGALSILPQAIAYRLNSGEVRLAGRPGIIFPTSISVFEETGVKTRNYIQEWFASHPQATESEQKEWLATRRNINFLFNRVTDEKLAVDQVIYNSLMVQLLLSDPQDPRFIPYFRLVYDNVFARIYEIMPEK